MNTSTLEKIGRRTFVVAVVCLLVLLILVSCSSNSHKPTALEELQRISALKDKALADCKATVTPEAKKVLDSVSSIDATTLKGKSLEETSKVLRDQANQIDAALKKANELNLPEVKKCIEKVNTLVPDPDATTTTSAATTTSVVSATKIGRAHV